MVVFSFMANTRALATGLAAVAALFGVNPALANSSASADIAAPLRSAQASKQTSQGKSDDQFRKLFNNWKSLDADDPAALVAASRPDGVSEFLSRPAYSVSIPSRMPLQAMTMTSSFGMRDHPVIGGRRAHKGVDLAAPVGTPIYATADGYVETAQWFGGYGLYVALDHGGDIETRYGHMSRLNVASGQRVKKGDIIGYVGSTGRSTGPHLHYEVRVSGLAVNPLPYMQGERLAAAGGNASRGGPE